jgi:hypothetical protein
MNKLQLYFDYYVKHYNPKESDWYWEMKDAFDKMDAIQAKMLTVYDFEKYNGDKQAYLNQLLDEANQTTGGIGGIEGWLNEFVFQQNNGVGDVKQGVVWDTDSNPQKDRIKSNATPELIFALLTEKDKGKANSLVGQLLASDRNLHAVQNRLLRTLFQNQFGSPDAPQKLERLILLLRNKLGITIQGSDNLTKHEHLCSLIETNDSILRQIFTWEIYYLIDNELNLKKAVVYYGAPGTGKTFRSCKEAERMIDQHRIVIGRSVGSNYAIQTVQFHPSYSYEDFIEGIRPSEDGKLRLFNGTFKEFCKVNGQKEIKLLQDKAFIDNDQFKDLEYDFTQIKVSDLTIDQKEILEIKDVQLADGITIQDVIEPAFFIIDEINRAELSKVFGELMYSLEYRGYKGKIRTQYSHLCKSKTEDAVFYWENSANWFFIPQNILIIATMNNIDRSVDAFDFALRRRFMWKEIQPDYSIIEPLLKQKGWDDNTAKKVRDGLKALNDLIENDEILDKNYRIGHSYVLELTRLNPERFDTQNKANEFIWSNFIEPLLEEYLKGLGNEQKAREKIDSFKSAFCL